jgi:hypothetical protein
MSRLKNSLDSPDILYKIFMSSICKRKVIFMAVTNPIENEVQVVESDSAPVVVEEKQVLPEEAPHRGMGCLWLYLPLTAVVLPIALSQSGVTSMGMLLSVVVLSLAALAYESGLRPGDMIRKIPGGVQAAVQTVRNPESLAEMSVSIRSGATIVAVGLMILSALLYNRSTNPDNNNWQIASFFLVLGIIALGIAVSYWKDMPSMVLPVANPLFPTRSNAAVTAIGVLMLLAVAEINGRGLGIGTLDRIPYWLQALLFFGGLGLVAWGLGGTPRLSIPWDRLRQNREVWFVGAVTLAALLIRVYDLENGLRASFDEVLPIEAAGHIMAPRGVGLVSAPSQYITTLIYSQWQTFFIEGFFGHTALGLRFTSALVGALSCIVVYLLVRDLFDRRTAMIAAVLLAAFPPHIHFSRIGLLHIADPFFGAMTILFIVRGIKYNQRIDWALAGVSLGLTQYFFEAGRLYFIPLVAVWIGFMLIILRSKLRPHFHGIVLMSVALIFAAMPAYYAIFATGKVGAQRFGASSVSSDYWRQKVDEIRNPATPDVREKAFTELGSRFLFPLQVYVRQPEMAQFYGGDQPLLLVYIVPFFLLGVFYLFWRFKPPSLIIVGWILSTAMVNILMRDQAHYPRWVVVFPAVVIAAAVGIRYVLPGIFRTIRDERRLLYGTGALVAAMAIGQVFYYYNHHVPLILRQNRESKPYPDTIDAALRSVDFPPLTDIYMVSDPISDIHPPRAWINYMAPNAPTMRLFVIETKDLTETFLAGLPTNRNYAFYVEPNDSRTANLLKTHFETIQSEGSSYEIVPADDEFILYFVPSALLRPQS